MENFIKIPNVNQNRTRKEIFQSMQKSFAKNQYLDKLLNKRDSFISKSPAIPKYIKKTQSPTIPLSSSTASLKPQFLQSFTFSKASRLDNSIYEKFKSIFHLDKIYNSRQSSRCDNIRQTQILSKNKIMSQYSPLNKRKNIIEKSQMVKFINDVVQITGKNLKIFKKQVQENKLRVKFNKLEIRQNKGVRCM